MNNVAIWLGRLARKIDFSIGQTYGARSRNGLLDGQPPLFAAVSLLALLYIVFSPFFIAGWWSATIAKVFVGAFFVCFIGMNVVPPRIFNPAHQAGTALLSALLLVFAIRPGDEYDVHVFILPALVFSVVAVAGRFLLRPLFSRFAQVPFRDALQREDVLASAEKGRDRFVAHALPGLITLPLRRPFTLLLPASVMILLAPGPEEASSRGLVTVAASFLVLGFGLALPRVDALLSAFERGFTAGTALVVSIFVVLLALGQLAEQPYVTTMVEASPGFFLFHLIYAAYAISWLFEFWVNRDVNSKLLSMFSGADTEPAVFTTQTAGAGKATRLLQSHGVARFAMFDEGRERGEIFTRAELLGSFSNHIPPDVLDDVESTASLYVSGLRIVAVVVLGLVIYASNAPVQPLITLRNPDVAPAEPRLDLRTMLFEQGRSRVILLAASGGGTRAALYSAAVLRGLVDMGASDDLVLASGVSGGSAALAYYAMHEGALRQKGESYEQRWDSFGTVMTHPYITDVLRQLMNWRIYTGTRIGQVLAESFDRRFAEHAAPSARRFGDVRRFGLILNSTLTGYAERSGDRGSPSAASAEDAGTIFLFTNLDLEPAPACGGDGMVGGIAADPDVALVRAASASANFPPAFPDAAVDSFDGARRWVTDGGAVENRGVISALFALRVALCGQARRAAEAGTPSLSLPQIYVIAADASAVSRDYESERGLSALLGAGDMLGRQLVEGRWQEVTDLYRSLGGDPGKVHLVSIEMPMVFRSRGGIGTHWMMPRRVRLRDPAKPADSPEFVEVSAEVATELVQELTVPLTHRPQPDTAATAADLARVREWIARDPFTRQWSTLGRLLTRVK